MPKTKAIDFSTCMRMMRKHNPAIQEEGFHALVPRANEFVAELMEEFQRETDPGLRCWLLELIGEARNPAALEVLVQQLLSDDDSLRTWAVHGLRRLDTREARRALFAAGVKPA